MTDKNNQDSRVGQDLETNQDMREAAEFLKADQTEHFSEIRETYPADSAARINISTSHRQKARIKAVADNLGTNSSDIVRRAIDEYLAKQSIAYPRVMDLGGVEDN